MRAVGAGPVECAGVLREKCQASIAAVSALHCARALAPPRPSLAPASAARGVLVCVDSARRAAVSFRVRRPIPSPRVGWLESAAVRPTACAAATPVLPCTPQ